MSARCGNDGESGRQTQQTADNCLPPIREAVSSLTTARFSTVQILIVIRLILDILVDGVKVKARTPNLQGGRGLGDDKTQATEINEEKEIIKHYLREKPVDPITGKDDTWELALVISIGRLGKLGQYKCFRCAFGRGRRSFERGEIQ